MKKKKKKPVRGEAILVTLILLGVIVTALSYGFYTLVARSGVVDDWNNLGKRITPHGNDEDRN